MSQSLDRPARLNDVGWLRWGWVEDQSWASVAPNRGDYPRNCGSRAKEMATSSDLKRSRRISVPIGPSLKCGRGCDTRCANLVKECEGFRSCDASREAGAVRGRPRPAPLHAGGPRQPARRRLARGRLKRSASRTGDGPGRIPAPAHRGMARGRRRRAQAHPRPGHELSRRLVRPEDSAARIGAGDAFDTEGVQWVRFSHRVQESQAPLARHRHAHPEANRYQARHPPEDHRCVACPGTSQRPHLLRSRRMALLDPERTSVRR
jgi:hypothetical protein